MMKSEGNKAIDSLHENSKDAEVSTVLTFWQQFDLNEKRSSWEKISSEIKEMKNAAIESRKKLMASTKAFRAKSMDEQVTSISDLIKAYQDAIDQLSNRSKLSENAFVSITKQLYDAPDPFPCIEHLFNTVMHGTAHTLEIERLRQEVRQYDEEFQRLKNQDITIRRLEDQIQQFKEQIEEKVNEELEKRAAQVEEESNSKVLAMKEMMKSLEKRLQSSQEATKQAQNSAERAQSQLFEFSTKADERISALLSENGILSETIQRLQMKTLELDTECNNLRKQLDAAQNGANNSSTENSSKFLVDERGTYDLLINQLREQLQTTENNARIENNKLEMLLKEQTALANKERESNIKLKEELQDRPSKALFLKLKHHCKVLQYLVTSASNLETSKARSHYSTESNESAYNEDDFSAANVNTSNLTNNSQHLHGVNISGIQERVRSLLLAADRITEHDSSTLVSDPEHTNLLEVSELEDVLLNKIKQLEADLALERRALIEMKDQELRSRETQLSLKNSLETSAQVIRKLEHDLEARTNALEKLLSNPNAQSGESLNTAGNHGNADLAELLGVDNNNNQTTKNSHSNSSRVIDQSNMKLSESSKNSNSASESHHAQMIAILQSQRDRYKEKLSQAESSALKLQQQVDSLSTLTAQLENDNLQLFTKIRFLQSSLSVNTNTNSNSQYSNYYNNRQGNTERRMISLQESRTVDDYEPRDIESKYSALYEQRISPFAEFSMHEKQRKLRELPVADRIVLNTALALITNHTGRSFLMVYLGMMHLLVFITVYYTVHHACEPITNTVDLHETGIRH